MAILCVEVHHESAQHACPVDFRLRAVGSSWFAEEQDEHYPARWG